MTIVQVRTHDYDLYILEQPSSWSTSRIRPSWPRSRLRLSLLLVSLFECISCLLWPLQSLTVCLNGSGFTPNPFIAVGRLLTNVQVNNITMQHDTHWHTNIHHISHTILLPFYTSSTLLGRLAGSDPSRLTQYCAWYIFSRSTKTSWWRSLIFALAVSVTRWSWAHIPAAPSPVTYPGKLILPVW